MRSLLAVLAIVSGAYDPGTVPPESTPRTEASGRVLHVGRGGIQAAIDRARPGDTIRVRRGTYRGRVDIRGASKRGLGLIGDGATVDGTVGVRDSAAITLRGLSVTRGVVVDDVDRYVLDGLRIARAGVAVRRSPGGSITRVRVDASPGAGISLAASPPQTRATRTFVRDVTVHGSAVGISLNAVRAVTVTRARLLGNATGVVAAGAREAVLSDSEVRGSQVGVALSAGSDLLLAGNRLQSNVTDVLGPQEAQMRLTVRVRSGS
jgi:nitrous oxidase accessory protein NosD